MFNNYSFKSSLWHLSSTCEKPIEKKAKSKSFAMLVLMLLFAVTSIQAQTQRIPSGDGNFSNGLTFASNGWTVANQGVSPVKWAVGTAASGTTQAATLNATTTVTLSASNAGIVPGQIVYGNGIAANTYVVSVAGTVLTLSQSATLSVSSTLGFGIFTGGISVGTTQTTTASVNAASYTITLSAANPNISVGMLIVSGGVIDTNTYVASINGTALGLSKATIGAAVVAQTLTFTATSAAISGNAAYISNDNGSTNSYGGYPTNRTVYFYRDITTIPSSQTAMTLTFDVKSAPASGGGWQVWVAPTSQTVTGTDTQVTAPFAHNGVWAGATQIAFNSNPQISTTKTTAFIPKSFAGTSFRLIFVWTHGTSAGTLPPAAIDNISLTSRLPEEITCAQSGPWSQPSTWTGGKVPAHGDSVVLDTNLETVMIDTRYTGCEDLILAGTNTLLQFAISTIMDEFTVYNDVNLAATNARYNNHDGTNGKYLKVGHNFEVGAGARFDSNIGGSGNFQGRLTLNGATVQTVTVDPAGFMGGSAAGVNTFANVAGVLNQLEVTNTSSASPNVIWDADGVRIKSNLLLSTGRVSIAAGKRLILGNFGAFSSITCPPGYGITDGTLSKWQSSASSAFINVGTEYPNTDVSFKTYWYPFVSGTNMNRSLYLLQDVNPSIYGEVAITYGNSNTLTTGLSIVDGSYTINNRYGANWSFSTPDSNAIPAGAPVFYTNSTGTHRLAVHIPGAYEATNGSSRLMNLAAALPGAHQEGTALPFALRTGLTLANLTAGAVYVGVNDASKIDSATAITSQTSGAWDASTTWFGGVVPTCTNNVIIATGNTVTVTTTADAASVVINAGGTLINNGAATTMTVGCTNNNSAFYNYGTYTMTSGTLKVNGFMSHKLNSTFNQTGGDIVIDSNDNGNAVTSVAFGGTSCKIETSNLALTGGKITIVDPLVNIGTPVSSTSIGNFTANTQGASGTFTVNTAAAVTTNSVSITGTYNLFEIGQVVTGHANIPANTTITNVGVGFIGSPPAITLTLSNNVTASIPTATPLNYSSMKNGGSTVVIEANAINANLAVGEGVSGPGIQAGSTITALVFNGLGSNFVGKITLSLPVSGLATSPIVAPQTLTFAAVTPGAFSTILTAANPSLSIGMAVSGTGLLPGTFITDITGAKITFSNPIQPGAPSPLVFDTYPFNTQSSGSFIYSSPNHYAAGLNHTLQIGDGASTQNTAVITNGFNCQFQALGSGLGLFSLGNLTVDAPDGDNRFMNVSSNNVNNASGIASGFNINVQNALTITSGSAFRKTFGNATVFVGGNIVNNGSFNLPTNGSLYLGNLINGVAVPSAISQTISGTGSYLANQWALTGGYNAFSVGSLTINNTSVAGVTIGLPNFRTNSVALNNGIVHTTAVNTVTVGHPNVLDTSLFPGSFSGGNATSYFDGPIAHANRFDSTSGQYRLFPTGKNGKYLPISIASSGGVELMAEAFDTNSGTTNPANTSVLSVNRWKVTRVGALGNFTGYNVRIGATPNDITASNLIIHSATENGTYDIVSSPASPAMTFTATTTSVSQGITTYIPNTINLTTAQTGGFLGNFSYASGIACAGTPAPVAAATATSLCSGQSTTLSLTGLTGTSLTYQWQQDTGAGFGNIPLATAATYVATPTVNTSYQCIVTCASVPGTSNAVAVTTSQITDVVTTTGATVCANTTANLTASGSTVLNWYTASTGGSFLTSGTSYNPTVTQTTTYYVAGGAVGTSSTVNTATWLGSTVTSTLFKGISFDVTNKLKLKTVTVYPKNTVALTPITIALYDATGTIVSGTTPVTFTPNLVTGTITNLTGQNVNLNYNIPVGTGYRLVATYGLAATSNTLGTSTAVITYPTGSSLRLTGNVSALNDAIVTTANTTNCFHNLTYDEICESTSRTAVVATVSNSLIDYANLQLPSNATICKGSTFNAYGQVGESGITEAAGQGAGIDVEFGYNAANTNPSTWSTWSTAGVSFNAQVGNNDEYVVTTGAALNAGTYYYTFRYKLSTCGEWQYGGYPNGFWNGTTLTSGVVTVDAPSVAPTSISGITTTCSLESTTLTVNGGSLGTGAVVQWFTGSCNGTSAGTGNSITVSPTSTTTYYVRYSGTCNTTTCAQVTVTVGTLLSVAPTGATGTTTICNGESTTLTLNGGIAGTGAVAQWFTGSCVGSLVGTGNSINVSPTSTTTYYVRYIGSCNTTTCATVTVTVNTLSVAPTGVTGTTTICGGSTLLSVDGGLAGSGATAEWFTDSCGGTSAGTGNTINVSPPTTTTYYVRYNGTCNTTTCATVIVTVNTLSVAPTGATGTLSIACGGNTTLTVDGGIAGTGATAEWFTDSCGGTPTGTGNSINVSPATTTTYYVRYNGICNTTSCSSVTVTVGPCESIVNLKLFIEGYYLGGGLMTTVQNNQDFPDYLLPPNTNVENITVELRDGVSTALVASTTAMLKTDGTAVCTFPTAPSGSFYIAVKTRNTVQTWSKLPQTVGPVPLSYDFSTAATKAFDDNQAAIGGGVYGFFSGDINSNGAQDDEIGPSDYSEWEANANALLFGSYPTDLNGDGEVGPTDYSIWETNANNFVFALYPSAP